LELGLPGSAITTLDKFGLPADAKRLHIGGTPGSADSIARGTPLALGPISKLDLTWDEPTLSPGIQPLYAAETRSSVRFEGNAVTTRARISVKVLRGESSALTIEAPADAELTASDTSIEKPAPTNGNRWRVSRTRSAGDFAIDVLTRRE